MGARQEHRVFVDALRNLIRLTSLYSLHLGTAFVFSEYNRIAILHCAVSHSLSDTEVNVHATYFTWDVNMCMFALHEHPLLHIMSRYGDIGCDANEACMLYTCLTYLHTHRVCMCTSI